MPFLIFSKLPYLKREFEKIFGYHTENVLTFPFILALSTLTFRKDARVLFHISAVKRSYNSRSKAGGNLRICRSFRQCFSSQVQHLSFVLFYRTIKSVYRYNTSWTQDHCRLFHSIYYRAKPSSQLNVSSSSIPE